MVDYRTIQQLKDYDRSRMKYPCLGQVKMDGLFGRRCRVQDNFFTRSGNQFFGLTNLLEETSLISQPLDGELVIPGLDFFTMNGLLRRKDEKPNCRFYVFDAPSSLVYVKRQVDYRELHEAGLLGPHVIPMKAHVIKNEEEADRFYNRALEYGHEGVVYKQITATYKDGFNGS